MHKASPSVQMEKDHCEISFVAASPLKQFYSLTETKSYISFFNCFSFSFALKTPHEVLLLKSNLKIVGPGEEAHRRPGVSSFFPSSACTELMNQHAMTLML